jgi:hypothetical protein
VKIRGSETGIPRPSASRQRQGHGRTQCTTQRHCKLSGLHSRAIGRELGKGGLCALRRAACSQAAAACSQTSCIARCSCRLARPVVRPVGCIIGASRDFGAQSRPQNPRAPSEHLQRPSWPTLLARSLGGRPAFGRIARMPQRLPRLCLCNGFIQQSECACVSLMPGLAGSPRSLGRRILN